MNTYNFSRLRTLGIFALLFFIFIPHFVSAAQETPAEIEQIVTTTFANDPVMITIAKCESGFRQFTTTGDVLRASGRYIGIFQIDEIIHVTMAKNLGFDIYTAQGNIGYAEHLYKNEGSTPWRNCAKKYVPVATTFTTAPETTMPGTITALGTGICPESLTITQKMKVSDRDGRTSIYSNEKVTEVALLQKHINRILAERYNQAAGPEDGIFGKLTKQGVERLQTALNDTLDMEKPLVVDGIVGPFTRHAINNSCGGDVDIL
jgi:peptidoglycan hydrolase-like protein with peptidoglycan-binding domain